MFCKLKCLEIQLQIYVKNKHMFKYILSIKSLLIQLPQLARIFSRIFFRSQAGTVTASCNVQLTRVPGKCPGGNPPKSLHFCRPNQLQDGVGVLTTEFQAIGQYCVIILTLFKYGQNYDTILTFPHPLLQISCLTFFCGN